MIILHKAKRVDNGEEVKGLLTKMWGEYHIIMENDEKTAYPVEKETIEPCLENDNKLLRNMEIEIQMLTLTIPMLIELLNKAKEEKREFLKQARFKRFAKKYSFELSLLNIYIDKREKSIDEKQKRLEQLKLQIYK